MAPLSARGQRLTGRYELERALSADPQAHEWLAHDAALDRQVVLRLLRPELAGDAIETERFWQAARASARAHRVGEPRILDGGTDEATGAVFLVREWRDEPGIESIDAAAPARPQPYPGTSFGARPAVSPSLTARVTRGVTGRVSGVGAGKMTARVLGMVLALAAAGALVGAAAGAWLAWVNEPLGRPAQSLNLAPAVGAQAGPTSMVARTPPPTPAAVARQQPAETTPLPAAATGAPDTGTPATGAPASGAPTTGAPGDGEPRRVVNTDGLGVALRASPGGDRQPGQGYAEGALVVVFEQQGAWARIRGADGREGWVLAVTLAPTAPGRPAAVSGPSTPVAPASSAQDQINSPAGSAGGRPRVVNTDGLGVALRGAPDGDRLPGKGYDEGATVSVLERSGTWTHVRGDDGRDGWVPTVTLTQS